MHGQQDNYGKSDPAYVAKVKDLCNELNLEVCPCFVIITYKVRVNNVKLNNA